MKFCAFNDGVKGTCFVGFSSFMSSGQMEWMRATIFSAERFSFGDTVSSCVSGNISGNISGAKNGSGDVVPGISMRDSFPVSSSVRAVWVFPTQLPQLA